MAPTATGMLMSSLTCSVPTKLNFQSLEFQALSLLPRMFFLELFERLAPFHISGLILEVTNPDSNYMTFWKRQDWGGSKKTVDFQVVVGRGVES